MTTSQAVAMSVHRSCRPIHCFLLSCFACSLRVSSTWSFTWHGWNRNSRPRRRPSSCCFAAAKAWKKTRLSPGQIIPELIVLDLDNCLWTPELYQLNPKKKPQAKKDIQLFPDVPLIFETIWNLNDNPTPSPSLSSPQWAIASRAQNKDWAVQLLQDFRIPLCDNTDKNDNASKVEVSLSELIPPAHIQIQGGTKKRHFQDLREITSIPYHRMIFFDDWDVNLQEVSQLGVLSCHCPDGLTLDIFRRGLDYYHDLKVDQEDNDEEDNSWMGYVI